MAVKTILLPTVLLWHIHAAYIYLLFYFIFFYQIKINTRSWRLLLFLTKTCIPVTFTQNNLPSEKMCSHLTTEQIVTHLLIPKIFKAI